MISGSKFRERASEMVKTSVVIFAFRTAAAWLYFNLVHGLFGRFFTSYAKGEQYLDDSLTGALVGAHPGKQTPIRRLRRRVALAFENSMIRHEISHQLLFFPQNHQVSFRIKEVGKQPEIRIGKTMGKQRSLFA